MPALKLLAIAASGAFLCAAAEVAIYPPELRPDPFGGVVAADGPARIQTRFAGARAGYISFHVVVKSAAPSDYRLDVHVPPPLQVDAFREWYHFTEADHEYYPDALIPVHLPYASTIPEPDNRIPQQTAQAFWVDVWIPAGASPGHVKGQISVRAAGAQAATAPFEIEVLDARVPDNDVVTIDHNSYGTSWLADMYPRKMAAGGEGPLFDLIHAYHRIFYEHRGIYHQLGYGHGGKVGPEFAPRLQGSGRTKHIVHWTLYDRHYGPLLDGSAFADTRRGAKPIPFVYLPINPEWPAAYLWWGEPGYETEFVNVLREMELHFREKGWTNTRLEVFFNHKKRYMGFDWDGDEVRFPDDNAYFLEYGRMLKEALPESTPVKFVMRADVSWDMDQQFRELNGIVRLWCASGGIFSWYPDAPKTLRGRGDIVWFYGGPPSVTLPSGAITRFPFQAWLWGVNGFVHWQTVEPGKDPWFHFEGGETALVYPGGRFGMEGPIPSIRLKLERNAVQDIDVIDMLRASRRDAAQRYNGSMPEDWWNPKPELTNRPPSTWLGSELDPTTAKTDAMFHKIDAQAGERLHAFAIELAREAK